MIILLSPAKTFNNHSNLGKFDLYFQEETMFLLNKLKKLDENKIKTIFKTSDKLTTQVKGYYQDFEFKEAAIYSYGGQVFKALDPLTINPEKLAKVYIFSALYGLVNAFDKISKYRLDFTNKILDISLYDYWGLKINNYLLNNFNNKIIINLASNEFTQTINANLNNLYHFDFILKSDNKVSRPSMLIKTVRGLFAREILTNNLRTLDEIKKIEINGFKYSETLTINNILTFIKE